MIKKNLFAKKMIFGLAVFSMIAFSSCKKNETDPKEVAEEQNDNIENDSKEKDASFLVDAAAANLTEVQMGALAKSKGQNGEVKAYGEMLEKDHSDNLMKVKALAATRSISVPSAISEDGQKMVDKMNGKDLKDFDKDFIDAMVDDHKKDVDNFTDYLKEGKDAEIKAYAEATLPTLQAHLAKAEAMKASMK